MGSTPIIPANNFIQYMRQEEELSQMATKIYNEAMILLKKEKLNPRESLYVLGIISSELLALSTTGLSEERIGQHIDVFLEMTKDSIRERHHAFRKRAIPTITINAHL